MTALITDSKDERLMNSPKDIFTHDLYRDSLRAMIAERDALLKAKETAEGVICRTREAAYRGSDRPSVDERGVRAALSSSAPCRHAPLAERVEDVEGMAQVIYKAGGDFQSDESIKFGPHWKDQWPKYVARAVQCWLKGEG